MATATRRWGKRVSEREIYEEFDIRGAANETEARNADNFPRLNNLRSGLFAEWPEVTQVGPDNSLLWRGTVRWTIPGSTTGHPDPTAIASGKPRYEWGDGVRQVPSYISADGFPITNGAGDPFDPPGTQDLYYETLTVSVRLAQFDYDTLKPFRGAINNDDLEVWQPGAIPTRTIKAGTMKCLSLAPDPYDVETTAAGKATALAATIGAVARFEVQEYFSFLPDDKKSPAWSPWHEWRENVGYRGWYRATGTGTADSIGDFVDSRGQAVTTPVRQRPTGEPIDTTFKVTDGKKDALQKPKLIVGYGDYPVRDNQQAIISWYLIWSRAPSMSFAELGTLLFPT